MAPTICDDEFDSNVYRHRHHRSYSVISYVGRSTSKENQPRPPAASYRINVEPNRANRTNESPFGRPAETRDISNKISRRRKLEDDQSQLSNDIVYDLSKRPKLHDANNQNNRRVLSQLDCTAHMGDLLPPSSPVPMAASAPTSTCTDKMLFYHRLTLPPPPHSSAARQRTLVEIAIKTVELLKRNQLLHERLARLQMETRQFVDSVMSNPENAPAKQADNQASNKSASDNKNLAMKIN